MVNKRSQTTLQVNLIEKKMGKMIGNNMEIYRMVSLEALVDRTVVVVGDAGCGKSALLRRFSAGRWDNGDYCPTVFADYSAEVDVGCTRVELALWDTGADYKLRSLAYPDKDVVLLCFSLHDADSLKRVETTWMPELRHHCPGVPVLLVGLQKDGGAAKVSSKHAEHVSCKIGAEDYVECSARTGKGVQDVFLTAANISLFGGMHEK